MPSACGAPAANSMRAFVTASTGTPAGLLARFSNLNGTPHLDVTNGTYLFAPYPVIDSGGARSR